MYSHCDDCGEDFENSFEYIDHILGEDEFDPFLLLPNNSKLMVGTLLRFLYYNADSPEQIRQISESSYVTLFAAEMQSERLEELIEDMVVASEMMRFDLSLKSLLEESKPDDNENGI
jgi:hypothetical protein